ncbi:hypothetical protein BGZ83_000271 [Gryganskiella cystojenkinii]|nr:hypothetical protein BGZ83_000271 [Gryganskiella cystojenkinii]
MHTLDLSVHPVTSTLKMLASLLERITTANDKIKQALPEPESPLVMTPAQHQIHTSFTRFHARSIPSISINAYLTRILKYCPCANECFLSLLVYFDRMARNVEEITGGEGRQFSIDSYNIHRLIIAGIMVSAKYFSDVFFTNSRYAKVGGLPVSELNQLEIEFLTLNNFALSISIEELQTYGDQLMKHWMCEEVANRDPEDETPSPAVPSAPTPPPPTTNEREYNHYNGSGSSNGGGGTGSDAEQQSNGSGVGSGPRYSEHHHHHDPSPSSSRYDPSSLSSRPSHSKRQQQQHHHHQQQPPSAQYSDNGRRENISPARQEDPRQQQQQQQAQHRQEYRQDYRDNSHVNEPHHDHHRREPQPHRHQDQVRDYRPDPHQSSPQQPQYYQQPQRSTSSSHGQHRSHQQHQQQQQHHHRQGQDSSSDRTYSSERGGGGGGRYQTPNAPITPTEMTQATGRLAAPSPIH